MAWIVVRSCALSIALALAGSVARAQTLQSSITTTVSFDAASRQNTRIVALLEQLADQARTSDNITFAVRAQSQAAKLLWAQDEERARIIFQRAFQLLGPGAAPKPRESDQSSDTSKTAGTSGSAADRRRLRTELLNQIAARDPEFAEELARDLAESIESSKSGCGDGPSSDCSVPGTTSPRQPTSSITVSREDSEQCELLMSAALQVVDRDPQQAMTFAQMSVALGISSNLSRLLTIMRGVDAERADLLFSNSMARLEGSTHVELSDLHTLGSYVVSVSTWRSTQPLSRPLVVRFLNFAFSQIERRDLYQPRGSRRDDSAFYFIGRQLTDLFARYLPERLDQLQRYLNDPTDVASYDEVVDPAPLKIKAPADIASEALDSSDPNERDSLYASASLGWLGQGNLKEAHAAALKIQDGSTRDRVLVQIVRRYSSEQRIDEAAVLSRRIVDETLRAEMLGIVGTAARAAKDNSRASELLNEAVTCALKSKPTAETARSLVMIAGTFSGFDAAKSFEVLQSAIKSINDILKQQEDARNDRSTIGARPKPMPTFSLEEIYNAGFETTLAALAKTDFEGALALARQLPGEEASVIAQLAVCGGGLTQRVTREQTATTDALETGFNHQPF